MKTLPKFNKEEVKRNSEIVRDRKKGYSYNKLAFKYQISPQRVREIVIRQEEKAEKGNIKN